MCLRSRFFKKACEDNFKVFVAPISVSLQGRLTNGWVQEGKTGQIDLVEDDPDIVDRMIDYLYRLDYDDQPGSANAKEPNGRLVINSLVYAIADKYEIWSLKDAAKKKAAVLVENEWNDDSFLIALETAWMTTPQSDRGLRDLFIPVLCTNRIELVKKEPYMDALRSIADLAADMVQALCADPKLTQKSVKEAEFYCTGCRRNGKMAICCTSCGYGHYLEAKR